MGVEALRAREDQAESAQAMRAARSIRRCGSDWRRAVELLDELRPDLRTPYAFSAALRAVRDCQRHCPTSPSRGCAWAPRDAACRPPC